MQALLKEFRTFLLRGNLVDMAVGIVIWIAFAATTRCSSARSPTSSSATCRTRASGS